MKIYKVSGGMPAKNNPNLGLAACFQTNTLFRKRHIRVYYDVCASRLSLKTRRKTCSREKSLINSPQSRLFYALRQI